MSDFLLEIPAELFIEIALYLQDEDLIKLNFTYKHKALNTTFFWTLKYNLDFPDVDWKYIIPDWKNYYFEKFYINYNQFKYYYNRVMRGLLYDPGRPTKGPKIKILVKIDINNIMDFKFLTLEYTTPISPAIEKFLFETILFIDEFGETDYETGIFETFDPEYRGATLNIKYNIENKEYYFTIDDDLHNRGVKYNVSKRDAINMLTYIYYNRLDLLNDEY